MKKSSVILTVLLVIALVFAVSCPGKTPKVSITGTDVTKEATVGTELADFTFDVEIANGEFLDSAKDKALTIKGLDAFDASNTEKASATATITALTKDKDNKNTKATVAVSKFTAKKATTEAKPLTFEIPASDSAAYVKDVKTAIAIGGKAVKVKASAAPTPAQQDVIISSSDVTMTFTYGEGISAGNIAKFTLVGATWKVGSLPTIQPDNGLLFTSSVDTDAHVLKVTVTGTPSSVVAAKDYTFTVADANVTLENGYKLPTASLTGTVKVTVQQN